MYSRFMDSTHPDLPAFHEGFADLVALLQHFTYPDIVKNQIRKIRGNLDTENLLAKLAVEFGQSTGEYSSLRDAIGRTEDGKWKRTVPNIEDYNTIFECHDRGALLVSAVFDAFLAIYKTRTADLVRLATGGSGILPSGEIHPDLVNRLSEEASKAASHVLAMCVRALDYCPPVDLNYGDYLRALITADAELVADDDYNYRIAFINAFRKRGIYPESVPNLSVETLCYNELDNEAGKKLFTKALYSFLLEFKDKIYYDKSRKRIFEMTKDFIRGDEKKNIKGLHYYLFNENPTVQDAIHFENLTGLVFTDSYKQLGIRTSKTYGRGPSIEIHSLRINNRTGPDGNLQNQIILTLTQRCKVSVKEDDKSGNLSFVPYRQSHKNNLNSFSFSGGCTLVFDLNEMSLKHVISKPIFDRRSSRGITKRKLELNQQRLKMQYRCLFGDLIDKMGFAPVFSDTPEPFALIHKAKNIFNEW
jgi:hypothetical protein